MSSYAVTRYVLVCDGCRAELGAPEGYASAIEMRAAGYAAGWRFPPRVKSNGDASKQTSDVCPHCLPAWTPTNATDSWKTRSR